MWDSRPRLSAGEARSTALRSRPLNPEPAKAALRFSAAAPSSPHDFLESGKVQRLRPVRKRTLGTGMHFNNQSVGANRNRGPRNGRNQALLAGSMRWIGNDRQMRKIARQRNRRQIERIPHFRFKRLDAALTQHDVRVAARQANIPQREAIPSP